METFIDGDRLIIIEGNHERIIPLMAIASYGELLGYSDPLEALEAILHIQDNGEPDPDPVTQENVWTDAYTLLTHREQRREQEAFAALEEGTADDPRSPALRSALAAHKAVHLPIDGGECAMDRCRRYARNTLGADHPTVKPGASSRMTSTMSRVGLKVKAPTLREVLIEDEVAPLLEEVGKARQEFLHSLTPNDHDPITPPEPEPEPADPVQATLQKYGGGANV